ncbi:hypothetical protein ES702_05290 [subsurface metagenome]
MTKEDNESSSIETEIVKDFPIHRRWRKIIVNVAKEQVNAMEEPEEWSEILQEWSWFRKPTPWIFETLDSLVRYPASSAYMLANNYMFDKNLESENTTDQEIRNLAARFRRALYKLYNVGLIRAITISPEEIGLGKNTVTIWVTPFAKEKQVERAVHLYKVMGGTPGRLPKNDKRTPKEITEHNRKMKAYAVYDRYKINPQVHDHYKCSKNHPEGLRRYQKIKSAYHRRKISRKCPSCKRDLIQIPYEEFMPLKKRALEQEFNVKL